MDVSLSTDNIKWREIKFLQPRYFSLSVILFIKISAETTTMCLCIPCPVSDCFFRYSSLIYSILRGNDIQDTDVKKVR